MTELEIIVRAQMYLEKLANGVNPLTGQEVPENDVVNEIRIARCLFYTSGILKQIVENKGKFKVECLTENRFRLLPNSSRASSIPNMGCLSRRSSSASTR